MSDSKLRDRIAAAIYTDWCRKNGFVVPEWDGARKHLRETYLSLADAVIAELERDGVPPAASAPRLQARLDNIGRWLHPGLWSAMDGRRGILARIVAGDRIEPPESARSTDWKAHV